MCFIDIVAEIVNLILGFESPKLDLYSSSYGPFSRTATGYNVLTLYTVQILGQIFGWKKEEIWATDLHGNYSCICKLDVGFLITQIGSL